MDDVKKCNRLLDACILTVLFLLFCTTQLCASPRSGAAFGVPARHQAVIKDNHHAVFVDQGETKRDAKRNHHDLRTKEQDRYVVSGRRARNSENDEAFQTDCNSVSASDMKMHKTAVNVMRIAQHHARKAYNAQSLRDITEGGKNVIRTASNLEDWQEILRQNTSH